MERLKNYKQLTFTANGSDNQPLPTAGQSPRISLDVTGNFVSSGGTSDPTIVQDAPFTLIKEVRLVYREKPIHRISGQDAYWKQFVRTLQAPPSTFGPISGAGTYPFTFSLPLPFSAPGSKSPNLSILRWLRDPASRIEVDFNDQLSLASGGDRTLSVSAVVAKVMVDFETEILKGMVFGKLEEFPVFLANTSKDFATVAAASTNFPIPLSYGAGIAYRGMMLRATLNGVRSNALLNNVIVKAGPDDETINIPADALQRRWADKMGVAQSAIPAGIYMLDFDGDKDWSKLFDVANLGELKLELNVNGPTGTTNIVVVGDFVRRLRAA